MTPMTMGSGAAEHFEDIRRERSRAGRIVRAVDQHRPVALAA